MLNLSLLLPLLKNFLSSKVFIGIVVLASLVGYHKYEVAQAYKHGGAFVQNQWNQDIEIRNAAFQAAVVQRNKEKLEEEQRLKSAQEGYDAQIKQIEAKYFASSNDNKRMRNQLATASTAGLGTAGVTETQCLPYVRRIEEVSSLLSEGTELLEEGGRYVEELAAKVKALQDSQK